MHYVILRDDDTNAMTPPSCLDLLFRPFLSRGLPVNLAVIPDVKSDVKMADGRPEGFLVMKDGVEGTRPIGTNRELVDWLRREPGVSLIQHGYFHELEEFKSDDSAELGRRLDAGLERFREAGLTRPIAFAAPQDQFSAAAAAQVVRRFPVFTTCWFDRHRIPLSWWPQYLAKKALRRDHWRVGDTLLTTRGPAQVSYQRPYEDILERVESLVRSRKLTILLTHWWEFFRDGRLDEPLLSGLHQVADFLASSPDVRVITFADLHANRGLFDKLM